MTTQIKNLFATQVMFGNFEPSVVTSVADELLTKVDFLSGGDLSDVNLLERQDLPEFQKFFNEHALPQFKQYTAQVFDYELEIEKFKFKAWGNNGTGNYSLGFHNHSGAQLSAVFYLLTEQSTILGGKFRFHDPRFNANRGMTEPFIHQHRDMEVLPVTGDFLIFPSYLYHSVSTFYGNLRLIVPVDMFSLVT